MFLYTIVIDTAMIVFLKYLYLIDKSPEVTDLWLSYEFVFEFILGPTALGLVLLTFGVPILHSAVGAFLSMVVAMIVHALLIAILRYFVPWFDI